MTSEELLGSGDDVPDDDGRAQREHNMFVVRVQNQAVDDLTYKSVSGELNEGCSSDGARLTSESNDGLQLKFFFHIFISLASNI